MKIWTLTVVTYHDNEFATTVHPSKENAQRSLLLNWADDEDERVTEDNVQQWLVDGGAVGVEIAEHEVAA